MDRIAIIGTAGRDKTKPMTRALWDWMVADAVARVPVGSHLVSGGAAWADHLAVELYLRGHASRLALHLPAPFTHKFEEAGGGPSAGSISNYYHIRFSRTISRNTFADIVAAICGGAAVTMEPLRRGHSGMFARNAKVAACEQLLAYTFASGIVPAEGGTKNTWNSCRGTRTHIQLPTLTGDFNA
jgi:hypothetical protein